MHPRTTRGDALRTTSRPLQAAALVALVALVALGLGSTACGSARPAEAGDPSASWKTTCSGCHGSAANAAPPRATSGETATTAPGVGAHQSHVTAAHGLAQPFDCTACHVKPAEVFAPGHGDGVVTVTGYTGTDPALLGAVKDPGYAAPTAASASCATSYCHGATLASQGSNKAPVWTKVDGTQAACGTCHAVPATTGLHQSHPGGTACTLCHGDVANDLGTQIVTPALHVNGTIDVTLRNGKAWRLTWDCSSCHY
ncbi:MAG TPA: CxxxxCH/CxxCH domain-containing protein [Anaeromyxobacteraceae bacterium]|nr:CxxxxCH/CxxCH domain-containing protein [Anaeromyxobacteraceae bacterium]